MRVVADTNVVISGLLWHGPPRKLLDAARDSAVHLFVSPPLLAEIEDVLNREKFRLRLQKAGLNPHDLVLGYAALTQVIRPRRLRPMIAADPDDDAVLACALAAKADAIVSGDRHLLTLREFRGIEILRPASLLARLPP